MVVGMGVGFGWRLGVSLRLGVDVGWFFSMALSGLSLGLDHGGHQMLGSSSRGLVDPKHGKNAKVGEQKLGSDGLTNSVSDNKCTGFLPWRNP
jgi:hypothetical protein